MKTAPADLALFGGKPAFNQPLHVGRPNLGDRTRLHERLDQILDRRWLTNHGACVVEFEQRLCALTGARHAMAFCNATIALEVVARAAGLTGEVIVPAFTFVATAHALHWVGLKPVFCDVDPTTHLLDPARVEALITPRTSGIMAVHLWGEPCNVEALTEIAARHRLTLLFDAAHAIGCGTSRASVGTFGLAEVFSFHATKILNTFEGGAVTTNDAAFATRVRRMMNFGFAGYDYVVDAGTNGKMSEAAAAMGLTSLESLGSFIAANRRNLLAYHAGLDGLPGVTFLPQNLSEPRNHQYVVVEFDPQRCSLSRDRLLQVLWAENIMARRYFYPGCHRMEPYRTLQPERLLSCPNSDHVSRRILVLPTGTAVSPEDIAQICALIRLAVTHGAEVERRLAGTPNSAAPPIPDGP